jgi:hypothetical protein
MQHTSTSYSCACNQATYTDWIPQYAQPTEYSTSNASVADSALTVYKHFCTPTISDTSLNQPVDSYAQCVSQLECPTVHTVYTVVYKIDVSSKSHYHRYSEQAIAALHSAICTTVPQYRISAASCSYCTRPYKVDTKHRAHIKSFQLAIYRESDLTWLRLS